MRTRIIIDDQDANEPEALETGMPFTLNVYRDDDDGTESRNPVEIGHESCLVGGYIPVMLRELADAWEAAALDARDRTRLDDEPSEAPAVVMTSDLRIGQASAGNNKRVHRIAEAYPDHYRADCGALIPARPQTTQATLPKCRRCF
jgi:hypothetical protein